MKVFLQWSLLHPTDWLETTSDVWRGLPSLPEPLPGALGGLDDIPGYVFALNIQGLGFSGYDHYAVQTIDAETIRVTVWKDDPVDYPPDRFIAKVWTIKHLAPDPERGDGYNTRQSQVIYAAASWLQYYTDLGPLEHTELHTWAEFVAPTGAAVRHGAWLLDPLALQHAALQTRHGYDEWIEGLPPEEIVDGKLRDQRAAGHYNRPRGTQTWFLTNSALADGIHTADNEEAMTVAAGSGTSTCTISAGGNTFGWTFVSPSNEPLDAGWPAGDYRCQMNITTAGADISYGLKTVGANTGHFARIDSGITTDEQTKAQGEATFTGTGTKLATTGTTTWTARPDTDRFEILIAVTRAVSMNTQTLVITNDSNSFVDGPWTPLTGRGPVIRRHALFRKGLQQTQGASGLQIM